jgi:iron complex outermembrane receptor protein
LRTEIRVPLWSRQRIALASFGELVTVTGGRWDSAETAGVVDHKFSPRAGTTLRVSPAAALYASWSRSFTPQPGDFTSDDTPLPPETGRNVELGLKVATPDNTLTGMISLFQLNRQNVATTDPVNPFFFVVTGEQRSRGVELE